MYEVERTKLKISTMTSIGDSTSATQLPIVFMLRENHLVILYRFVPWYAITISSLYSLV